MTPTTLDLSARIARALAETAPPAPPAAPAKPKLTGTIPLMNHLGDQIATVFILDGDEAGARERGRLMCQALQPLTGKDPACPSSEVPPRVPVTSPLQAPVRAALSGAFGEAIDVRVLDDQSLLAVIPAGPLATCGIKFVETAAPVRSDSELASAPPGKPFRVLTGNPAAVENACNRIGKPLGEGWTVTLDSFSMRAGREVVHFRLVHA